MAFVKNPQGVLGQIPDDQVEKAIRQGYTRASYEEVEAAKAESARKAEAEKHPLQAAGESALKGAVDTFTSPFRAAGGLLETAIGPNVVSEATGHLTGQNALAAVKDVSQGLGGNKADVDAATQEYMRNVQAREEANPVSSALGGFAGDVAGFGPLGALAGGAGGATTKVLGGAERALARRAGYAVEGAVVGGVTGLAGAADEAHEQDSYLKGEQAIAAVGLGALLGGTLNLAGRSFADKITKRYANKFAIPELEATAEGEGVRELSREELQRKIDDVVSKREARKGVPALEKDTGKDLTPEEVRAWTESGPAFEDTERVSPDIVFNKKAEETTAKVGRGAIVEEELPRHTKYNPEAKTPDDLLVPGKGPAEVNELEKALSGEDLHMRNRAAKVDRLLTAVPPGAQPEWVLGMSEAERAALWEFVNPAEKTFMKVPKIRQKDIPSDDTWRALADAVAEREDILPNIEKTVKLPPTDPGFKPAVLGEPKPYSPQARTKEDLAAIEGLKGDEHIPSINSNQGVPKPYSPQLGQAPSDYANPTPYVSDKTPEMPMKIENKTQWGQFVKNMMKWSARRMAGRAVGGALGGTFGPVGYWTGYAAGYGFDKMANLAGKTASLAGKAIEGAVTLGSKAPSSVTLGAEENLVRSVFYQEHEEPELAFQARIKELQNLKANNSELIINRVSNSFGATSFQEKGAVIAAMQTAQRGVDYLLAKAPQQTPDTSSLTPIASGNPPNRSDLNTFALVYTAVMQPKSVLQDIKTGSVTDEQIAAVKNVYPQWYQENIVVPYGTKLRERDIQKKPLLPVERKAADVTLGTNTGVDATPFVDRYGPAFAQKLYNQQEQSPGPSGRKLTRKTSIGQTSQTQTSRILGPIQ